MGKVIPPVPDTEKLVIVSNRGPARVRADDDGERQVAAAAAGW